MRLGELLKMIQDDMIPWDWDWVRFYGENTEITVYDNEYGVSYSTVTGEWI